MNTLCETLHYTDNSSKQVINKLRNIITFITPHYGIEERCTQGCGGGNLGGRDYLEHPGVDGKIILRYIFRKWDWGHGLD